MTNALGRIRPYINRFSISAAIFSGIILTIGANANPKAKPLPDVAPDYTFNEVDIHAQKAVEHRKNIEVACGVALIYGEARGESDAGKRAVIETALNRVESKYYPDNLCDVVFQDKQFSFANPNDPNRAKTFKAIVGNTFEIEKIRVIAFNAIERPRSERIAVGLHYLANSANPPWRKSMPREGRMILDGHTFFASNRP